MAHEWIDNNSEFEAVLVCTNELGAWDQGAVVRAFQIYQWDDATTPGNDSSFVHLASGVVVRHDGNMLAIDCGHGYLDEALPDLFSVLNSIGWREAELYHPAATINALLSDMGRAISARMDFEVRPAQTSQGIQELPESVALTSRAKAMFAGAEMDESNAIVLQEMQSMIENPSGSMFPLRVEGPVTLLDDDGGDDTDVIDMAVSTATPENRAGTQASPQPAHSAQDHFDEQPQLFILPTMASAEQSPQPEREDEMVSEPGENALVSDSSANPVFVAEASAPDPSSGVANASAKAKGNAAELQDRPNDPPSRIQQENDNPLVPGYPSSPAGAQAVQSKIISVGASVLCFSYPSSPIGADEVAAIAAAHKVAPRDILRIQPGVLGSDFRWDVLGEIDQDAPWFATQIAMMLFPESDTGLMTAILLAAKAQLGNAQLRDLLCRVEITEEEFAAELASALPACRPILARARINGDLASALDTTVRRIGPLALAPEGKAFFDIRVREDDVSPLVKPFTVRQQLGATPSLMLFEIDQLDGPFIMQMTDVLRDIAGHYSLAARSMHQVFDFASIEDPAITAEAVAAEEAAALAARAELEHRAGLVEQIKLASSNMHDLVGQLLVGDLTEKTYSTEI